MNQIGEFTFSRHALQRAVDMGIPAAELRECLTNPQYVAKSRRHKGDNYRRGRITCGVVEMRVVTVVWSSAEGWRRDLKDKGSYAGRVYRGAA